jgi:hypothetical protein
MVNVGMFYDHLEYFMAIWYNLWLFGIVCGHLLYIFPNLECLDQEKSGNPGSFGSFKAQKTCFGARYSSLRKKPSSTIQKFQEWGLRCNVGFQNVDLIMIVSNPS